MKIKELLKEGIVHIEDLQVEEFIDAIRNLNQYNITEKIDGFNLKFSLDENGFLTFGKDDKRIYNADDWGNEFRYTGFKSAHKALEKILPQMLEAGFYKSAIIEVEVLFGKLPNTVPYLSESNKIIFLRTLNFPGVLDINKLKEALDGITIDVAVSAPYTKDGRTIQEKEAIHSWTFSKTPHILSPETLDPKKNIKLEQKLQKLQEFLTKESGYLHFSHAEILALKFNKKPEKVESSTWKSIKGVLKEKKIKVKEKVDSFKLDIKQVLLNELIRNIQSKFGPDIKNGGWIEGVVLEHKENFNLVKIVDKDMFTTLNKFNWHVRNKIGGNPKGINCVESVIGNIKVSLGKVIGHPELGTQQRKRHIKKHELTFESLAADLDFNNTKKKFNRILTIGEQTLNKFYDAYQETKGATYKEINFGNTKRRFHIDEALDEKNLESFAELFCLIQEMKQRVELSQTSEDLTKIILG